MELRRSASGMVTVVSIDSNRFHQRCVNKVHAPDEINDSDGDIQFGVGEMHTRQLVYIDLLLVFVFINRRGKIRTSLMLTLGSGEITILLTCVKLVTRFVSKLSWHYFSDDAVITMAADLCMIFTFVSIAD